MDVSLVRFNNAINHAIVDMLSDGWDWPLSDAVTLNSFVSQVVLHGEVAYWVFKNSAPVGVLELSAYGEDESLVDVGIFIHKDFRGIGIAEILLHSTINACNQIGTKSVATVHVDNARSLGLMRKATGLEGIKIFEPVRGREAFIFHLADDSILTEYSVNNVFNLIVEDAEVIKQMLN